MNETVIFVDGACSGNPGKGGWAALIRRGTQEIIATGNFSESTNNQMELAAAIGGLEMLRPGEKATLYSDSKYVVDGITKWIFKWRKSNWVTATGERVKNRGLWERLLQLTKSGDVKILWIRGHSNDEMDKVDALAKQQTFLQETEMKIIMYLALIILLFWFFPKIMLLLTVLSGAVSWWFVRESLSEFDKMHANTLDPDDFFYEIDKDVK